MVAICSEAHLARCLTSLQSQSGEMDLDIVVAAAPRLGPLKDVRARFPSTTFVDVGARETPIELAASAVNAASGAVVLLTEDHCSAHNDWASELSEAVLLQRRTVGGPLDAKPGIERFDWAFYFVDFFRYARPRSAGPATSISVCNAGYLREQLEKLGDNWLGGFHETRVHDELMKLAGPHYFEPAAGMLTGRMVGYGDGHRERYAFGRIFAAGRIDRDQPGRRALYAIGTAALPVLLISRMAARAVKEPTTASRFVRALPHIVTLVLAWTAGEFLGYVTGTLPANRDAARERHASTADGA